MRYQHLVDEKAAATGHEETEGVQKCKFENQKKEKQFTRLMITPAVFVVQNNLKKKKYWWAHTSTGGRVGGGL